MKRPNAVAQDFFRANRNISQRIEKRLPHARCKIHSVYEQTVAAHMNRSPNLTVVDIGSGKACPFARFRNPELSTTIVGLDISREEMAENRDVDTKVVGNAAERLPFADNEVDLVVSRSVLEHLTDVEPFVAEAHRVLKGGGYTIHVFPSKYAPFSVLNRFLPKGVSSALLSMLVPGSKGILGFPAFYDHCTPHAMEHLFQRHGFEIVESRTNYYQADYFGFFVPFYLLNAGYELVISRLNRRSLAASALIVARKTEGLPEPGRCRIEPVSAGT